MDQRQTHHHKYFTHWPLFWLILIACSAVWIRYASRAKFGLVALTFALGGLLHMVLDSVVGDIWWFAPFVDEPYSMFTVQARVQPWWLNFIVHGSFVAELVICAWAVVIYRRRGFDALQS